jgi:hypothetical protein
LAYDLEAGIIWNSTMTFGEFVIGLFNKAVFPCDKHMTFKSKENGAAMGELLVGLLERAGFKIEGSKSKEAGSRSLYTFSDSLDTPKELRRVERVVTLMVERPDYFEEQKGENKKKSFPMFFPPNCKIDIECEWYPF